MLSGGGISEIVRSRTQRSNLTIPADLLASFTSGQIRGLLSQAVLSYDCIDKLPSNGISKWFSRASERMSKQLSPLTQDHLIPLIKYNVFRGLIMNIFILGVESIASTNDPHTLTYPKGMNLPPDLRPTIIQSTVAHPVWIDIFPDPIIRDTIILHLEELDADDLCVDIVGNSEDLVDGQKPADSIDYPIPELDSRQGLLLWGDPWDIKGWEATPAFIRKWTWILKGSPHVLTSTNYWRNQRGEPPLVIDLGDA
jgi:hypothetical protein